MINTQLAVFDIDRQIVALPDRLGELDAVPGRPVIVGLKHERAALPPQENRVGPPQIPLIARHPERPAVRRENQRVLLAGLIPERIVQHTLDALTPSAGP